MSEPASRRVLVTGAAGFIGANLVRALVAQGASVHALVRPGGSVWRLSAIRESLHLHETDVTSCHAVRAAVEAARPDVIYNLVRHGGSSPATDRRVLLNVNLLGTLNLLEATASLGYQRFVHVGSSLEYGRKSHPMREDDLLEPATDFAVTKAAATLMCQQFARAHAKPIVVLRLFSVYGYWEAPSRIIPAALLAVLANRPIPLTPPGYRRDPIFVDDVVEACLLAAQAERVNGEILNVGSGRQWANEEIVETIQRVAGRRVPVRVGEFPPRMNDTTHWVADIGKAERLLGWAPRHSLEAGLQQTWDWLRSNRDLYDRD